MRLRWHWILASLALYAMSAASPRVARAQDLGLDEATRLLSSTSHDDIETAIGALGLLGDRRAVAPLSERIRAGLPPDLLLTAIDTLTVLGQADAGPVLFELVAHRRPGVRLRVVQAIAACRPRGADRALVSALGDSSPAVRAAAATALGELGATSAIDSLFLAFEREVPEAGVALGRIARADDVPRILEHLGSVPFTLMRQVLSELLVRRDLAERARLDVIARLGELATAEVRTFLEELMSSLSGAVARAAQDTITRIAQ